MKRREFLKLFASLPLVVLAEPIIKLPKLFFIKEPPAKFTIESQIINEELFRLYPKINQLFENDNIFYNNIKNNKLSSISGREISVPLEIKA